MRTFFGLGAYPLNYRAVVLWRLLEILVFDRIFGEQLPRHCRGTDSIIDETARRSIMDEIKPFFPQVVKMWLPRFVKRPAARKRFLEAFHRAVAPEPSASFRESDAEYEAADPGSVIYRAIANVRRRIHVDPKSPMVSRELAEFIILTIREETFEAMKLSFDDRLPDLAYLDRQREAAARRQAGRAAIDSRSPGS